MKRLCIDTNVYISGIVFGGLPRAFLELGFGNHFGVLISPPIIEELTEKLSLRFGLPETDVVAIFERILSVAHLVVPEITLSAVPGDPDDDRILECAVSGRADAIVTGDRHLLSMGQFQGIAIVTVREALFLLEVDLAG